MTTPPYDDLVATVERAGGAMLDAVRDQLEVAVPTCGDWDARRLLAHVGRVYRGTAALIVSRAKVAPATKAPAAGADVVEYYAEGLAMVLDALRTADPADDVWNWHADRPMAVTWWARRMAHETVVHRADAELAVGREPARGDVEPALAADGVDEFLEVMLPRQQRRATTPGLEGTLHLHATDPALTPGTGEWLLRLSPTSCDVRRSHDKGDAALRGAAYDLLLVLYNRLPASAVEAHGDERLLDAWRATVTV